MSKLNKNIFILIGLALETVMASTLLYYFGMNHLEGRPRTMIEALEWVTQTMTTVGYGQDPPWNSQLIYLLAIFTQLSGVTIVFLSIPTVVTPWMKQRLSVRPDTVYTGSEDHVIITEYTSIVGTLIDELNERGVPYVLIESDEDRATELYREGYEVILGDPVQNETFENAKLEEARLVILDCPDQRNASIALTIQENDIELPIIAVAEQKDRAAHLSAAGIDKIIYPREEIGEILARKALSGLGKKNLLEEKFESDLEIREYPVLSGSPLVNTQLSNSGIRENVGVRIIGVWRAGRFMHNPSADFRIHKDDILVASGSSDALNDLHELTEIRDLSPEEQNVLIVGYGKEGHRAEQVLESHGINPVTLNDIDIAGVDIVGDGSDPETLKEAEVEDMATVIITVSDDETAILITLMVNDLNPKSEILVQINNETSLEPIYRAGASYVLSLEQLTSQLLAGSALEEDLLYEELNLRVRRCGPGRLTGETPDSCKIGEKYRITVVGVERNGEMESEIGPDYTFQKDDVLYLAGNPGRVKEFADEYELTDYDQGGP